MNPCLLRILLVVLVLTAPEVMAEPQALTAEVDWIQELLRGGNTGIALFILSFIMITMAVERAFNLRASRIIPRGFSRKVMPLWRKGRYDELLETCAGLPSTISRMASFLVEHRSLPAELLIQGASDIGVRELLHEQKRAYGLAVIAGLAPLLGLLGTIIGMIESFKLVEIYGDDGGATILAGSISKALITTALGLIIAIPSMALYHLFKFKTQALNKALDEEMEVLINEWLLKSMQVSGESAQLPPTPDGDDNLEPEDGGAITFYCQACRQKLQADADMAGTVIACPRCNTSIKIPAASAG